MSFTVSLSLLKILFIVSMIPSNHLNLCHPILLLLSIFPSIRVFSDELALHIRWPKYWNHSQYLWLLNIIGYLFPHKDTVTPVKFHPVIGPAQNLGALRITQSSPSYPYVVTHGLATYKLKVCCLLSTPLIPIYNVAGRTE